MASTQPERQYPIEFQVEARELSIAPGHSSEVPITLSNHGESSEMLEIKLFGVPAGWVSGIRGLIQLAPGEEQSYELIFDPPSDAQVGRYPFGIQATSQDDPELCIRTRIFINVVKPETTPQDKRIALLVGTNAYSVAPGSDLSIPVVLVYQGQQGDSFKLAIEGVPDTWLASPEIMVHLLPGEQRSINLNIKPPLPPGCHATRKKCRIVAHSYRFPEDAAKEEIQLTVAACEAAGRADILLEAEQYALEPGGELNLPVVLINESPVMDTFNITVDGLPSEWISPADHTVLLLPGQETTNTIAIRLPRHSMSRAGRIKFNIRALSVQHPDHPTEADCTLIVQPFNLFSGFLQPGKIKSGEVGSIVINNQGNSRHTYQIAFESEKDILEFSVIQPPNGLQQESATPTAAIHLESPFVPGQPPELSVNAGQTGTLMFKGRPRRRPFIGNDLLFPFKAQVSASGESPKTIDGMITEKAWMPLWLFTVSLVVFLAACISFVGIRFFNRQDTQAAPATQTAAYYQTLQASTTLTTTAPTISPSVGPDSDGDGLSDPDQNTIGTDPLNPDTDGDQLLDGQESLPCPDPLNPDSDGDGLVDGIDQDPCDPTNPQLTPGAGGAMPTPLPPTPQTAPIVTPPTPLP